MSLADLESFTASANIADYVPLGRYLFVESPGGNSLIQTNAFGAPCLDVHGDAPEWWRRRLFRPGGIATGTRGGRCLVSQGILVWGWYDAAAGVVQCSVQFDATTGQVRAYLGDAWGGGATLIGQTGLMTFPPGAEFFAEVQVTIGTGTAGAIAVKLDTVTVLAFTGIATQSSPNAAYHTTQDGWIGGSFGYAKHASQSDLYWTDDTRFLGPGRVFGLTPAANGAAQDFTPFAGANWQNVNGTPPKGDAAYNVSGTVGAKDLFQTTAAASGIACAGLMVSRNSRIDAAGTGTGRTLLKSGAATADGAATIESTSYTTWFDLWDNDPATGAPFTVSAVNLAQPGYTLAA